MMKKFKELAIDYKVLIKKMLEKIEEEAIKVVCDNTKLDIPNGMIELEIDNMIKDMETRLSYQGLNLNQYLQNTFSHLP